MFNNKEFILKKTIVALTLSALFGVASAGVATLEVDRVKIDNTSLRYNAQYLNLDGKVSGVDMHLQARTASLPNVGVTNSLELTASKGFGAFSVFAGLGHDNGTKTVQSFDYGLVGASTGARFGVVDTFVGVKTRVTGGSEQPKQTVVFAGASMPLTKVFSLNFGASKSYQTIKETAWGMSVSTKF